MAEGKSNFERMMQLAEDVFAVKNDPDQLDVNEKVIEHLLQIHPATVSEFDDGNGPAAWVLLIPTTEVLMHQFLAGDISEKKLYEMTPLDGTYEAVYLCSAMVLEEYRRQGITTGLVDKAMAHMIADHPIKSLFYWPFTIEGEKAAESIASRTSLTLHKHS